MRPSSAADRESKPSRRNKLYIKRVWNIPLEKNKLTSLPPAGFAAFPAWAFALWVVDRNVHLFYILYFKLWTSLKKLSASVFLFQKKDRVVVKSAIFLRWQKSWTDAVKLKKVQVNICYRWVFSNYLLAELQAALKLIFCSILKLFEVPLVDNICYRWVFSKYLLAEIQTAFKLIFVQFKSCLNFRL